VPSFTEDFMRRVMAEHPGVSFAKLQKIMRKKATPQEMETMLREAWHHIVDQVMKLQERFNQHHDDPANDFDEIED
jgi:hypothetical protein